MNAKQKIHQANLADWAVRFKEQTASGLTVKIWCEKNGYSIHTYNYWKHVLKEKYVDSILPDIVALSVPATYDSGSLPILSGNSTSIPDTALYKSHDSRNSYNHPDIVLSLGDVTLNIFNTTSDELITRVLKAVRNA